MSAYSGAVLATSPLHYWRLGESSGTTGTDEVGTQNATYIGTPTLGTTGLLTNDANTAMTCASGKYATAGTFSDITSTASWAFWINPGAWGSYSCIFTKDHAGGQPQWRIQRYSTSSNLVWYDGTNIVQTSSSVSGNTFVVLTMNAGSLQWYLNGATAGTGTALNPLNASWADGQVILGTNLDGQPYVGVLDEVAIWTSALTSSQVAYLYNVGKATINPALNARGSFRLQAVNRAATY